MMSDDVLPQPERKYQVAECRECGRAFEQFRASHVYCTKACALVAGKRRRDRDEFRTSEETREQMRRAQAKRRQRADDDEL